MLRPVNIKQFATVSFELIQEIPHKGGLPADEGRAQILEAMFTKGNK